MALSHGLGRYIASQASWNGSMALSQGLGGCGAYVSDSRLILGEGGSGQSVASLTKEEDPEELRVVLEAQKRDGP